MLGVFFPQDPSGATDSNGRLSSCTWTALEGDEIHTANGFHRYLLAVGGWWDLGILGSIPGSRVQFSSGHRCFRPLPCKAGLFCSWLFLPVPAPILSPLVWGTGIKESPSPCGRACTRWLKIYFPALWIYILRSLHYLGVNTVKILLSSCQKHISIDIYPKQKS